MLDQKSGFKIYSVGALKSFLEVNADLVEWTLNVPMSIPEFLRTFFNKPEIVEDITSLFGLTKLTRSWEHCSPDL